MKKLTLLILFIGFGVIAFAQRKVVCCSKPSATRQFAMLASSENFRAAHHSCITRI